MGNQDTGEVVIPPTELRRGATINGRYLRFADVLRWAERTEVEHGVDLSSQEANDAPCSSATYCTAPQSTCAVGAVSSSISARTCGAGTAGTKTLRSPSASLTAARALAGWPAEATTAALLAAVIEKRS